MEREFFFPFLPPLQITKMTLIPPKVGAKMEKKILSPLTVPLIDRRGKVS
jgi:hypothetical protein